MPNTVLICIKNLELGVGIAKLIEDDLHEELGLINTPQRPSRKDAEKMISDQNIDLVITDFRNTSADTEEDVEKGASLLFSAERCGEKIPFILISHIVTPKLHEVISRRFQCRIVEHGRSFQGFLKSDCKDFLTSNDTPKPLDKKGLVEITMDMDSKLWDYQIRGSNRKKNYSAQGVITMKLKALKQLLAASYEIEEKLWDEDNKQAWVNDLEKIGRTIFHELFDNNPHFSRDFYRLDGIMEERRNIRFCFKFKKSIHSVHLEAIFDDEPSQWPHYLSLISPVYRTLNLSGLSYQTPFDRQNRKEKVNCLLIKSDKKGFEEFYPGLNMKFKGLNYAADEITQIYNLMKTYKGKFNIGKIRVLDLESSKPETEEWKPVKKNEFISYVRQTLEQGNWHIVHYAGHSYYADGKGYIIFPRTADEAFPIGFGTFSSWLRTSQTQLLFLCSCHSSADNIVFELARNQIPAILGFRWNLSDHMALKYATIFYRHLVEEGKTLEKAFQHTTRDLYEQDNLNPIWASPVLIKQ